MLARLESVNEETRWSVFIGLLLTLMQYCVQSNKSEGKVYLGEKLPIGLSIGD
jgi:hypothetical protein